MKTASALQSRRQRVEPARTAEIRLTADRSTTELRWIALGDAEHTVASPFVQGKRCFGTKEKLLAQHSSKKLVAGARFEPAIPQTRDYEPSRGRPVIL